MKRITLISKCKWDKSYCNIYYKNNKNKRVFAKKLDKETFYVDVDELEVDYVSFSNGHKEKTNFIYVNGIEDTYIYKYNKAIKKNALYVGSNSKDGLINSIVLVDKKNLSCWTGKKRIWIYSPSFYDEKDKYGLIIAFDGQNAFFKNKMEKKNPYGGIQLDEYVEKIKEKTGKKYIVVGIDNGSKYRDEELTMDSSFGDVCADNIENNEGFYNGNLDGLLDFIIETVLPYVRKNYSIDCSNVGLYGASSGGLASFYGALRNPDVYSFALSFSPAFLLFSMKDFESFIDSRIKQKIDVPYIYMYSGKKGKLENTICGPTKDMYELLKKKKEFKNRFMMRINNSGNHNEIYWRIAISEGLKFIIDYK